MVEVIFSEIAVNVATAISNGLFGKLGGSFYSGLVGKSKVNAVLKKDRKQIHISCQKLVNDECSDETVNEEEISSFLFQIVFQDSSFLYPTSKLPIEKTDKLWIIFCDYINKNRNKDVSSCKKIVLPVLIECVEYHNDLVSKYFLSEGERIITKAVQRSQMDLMGYIGTTISLNTKLQQDNRELDYLSRQLEAILYALRMEATGQKRRKLILVIAIEFLYFFSVITITVYFKFHLNINMGIMLILLAFPLVILICMSFVNKVYNIAKHDTYDKQIKEYIMNLWSLNYRSYCTVYQRVFHNDSTE